LVATAQKRTAVWDILAAVSMVVGAWLVASPYVIDFWLYDPLRLNCTFIGGTVVGLAIAQLALSPGLRWLGWLNVVLGLWIAAIPFVYGVEFLTGATVSCVASGLAIAACAAASILGPRRERGRGTG
jgi:hypothetical protein